MNRAFQSSDDTALPCALSAEARRLLTEGGLADVLGSFGAVAVISLATLAHADTAGILVWASLTALALGVQLCFPWLFRRLADAPFLAVYTVLAIVFGVRVGEFGDIHPARRVRL